MAVLTIRNLPPETHRALRERAAAHSRSTEAEVRAILESVARPAARLRLGAAIEALAHAHGAGAFPAEPRRERAEPAPLE